MLTTPIDEKWKTDSIHYVYKFFFKHYFIYLFLNITNYI